MRFATQVTLPRLYACEKTALLLAKHPYTSTTYGLWKDVTHTAAEPWEQCLTR